MRLGLRIREIRKQQGWSQSGLARLAGLTAACVHQLETRDSMPSINTLMKLCAVFGMSMQQLMDHTDFPKSFTREEAEIFFVNWHKLTLLHPDDQFIISQIIDRLLAKQIAV